jgi:endonuclease III
MELGVRPPERQLGPPSAEARTLIRAAEYVRMSTEHQKYSTENQSDAIRNYAARRGMEIVRTYADAGKSGLRLDGRDALKQLLADVESGSTDFEAILVYDISRWGRFQDADESAYYEYRCKRAGISVQYCAEQFENDGSPVSTIVKGVKRAMAGEYSRELSAKVFAGQCRLIELGYGTPWAELGNKADPLDEAVYIILSFQTGLDRARATWSKLQTTYKIWPELEGESDERLANVLREGGLQLQKARLIKGLFAEIRRRVGRLSLDILRSMSLEDAERFLLGLPGLSWKGARCVLLYSLGADAFPVDINTFRILRRLGVIPRSAIYRRRSLHDALQNQVAIGRRGPLHVNLVVHGQRTCLPRNPRCSLCPLVVTCPRIGMRRPPRLHTHLAQEPNKTIEGSAISR